MPGFVYPRVNLIVMACYGQILALVDQIPISVGQIQVLRTKSVRREAMGARSSRKLCPRSLWHRSWAESMVGIGLTIPKCSKFSLVNTIYIFIQVKYDNMTNCMAKIQQSAETNNDKQATYWGSKVWKTGIWCCQPGLTMLGAIAGCFQPISPGRTGRSALISPGWFDLAHILTPIHLESGGRQFGSSGVSR